MLPGERFKNYVDELAMAWKDRLRDWMAGWLAWGLELILDTIGRGMGKRLDTIIDAYGAEANIPPEKLAEIKDIWRGEGEWQALLGYSAGGTAVGSLIGSTIGPWLKLLEYKGLGAAKPARLDIPMLVSIWLRDKEAYEQYFQDLRDQGWNEDRINILKELSNIIPPLADMVRFADFGSFDPKVIEMWREFYDAPGWMREPMALLGVTGEWANRYWFSHWRQPGRYELGELHRRGLIDDELVKNAYLTQGFSSFWQEKLLELVKEPWTRVDIRRMWDMRTISEEEMRKAYRAHGYYDEWLEGMVLWTKVYVAFPDLLARWTNGWITMDDVRSELVGLGMPAARVEEMIQTKMKPAGPGRVTGERDLTKTDIYKGIKQGRITRAEGIEFLVDLGFDEDEADYLLAINIPVDQEDPVIARRALTKADIYAGLKEELITESEALDRLLELRYVLADAEFLLSIWQRRISPPEEAREREASKADITLAVKKGLVTPEEGYMMLLDIGFTPAAAEFILMVRAETTPFSPANYQEFKDLTQKYRIAAGREAKPMSEELKAAAAELVKLTAEVKALQKAVRAEEKTLVAEEILPEAATEKRDELRVSLHRAESALAAAQTDYDGLLAQWRHGG